MNSSAFERRTELFAQAKEASLGLLSQPGVITEYSTHASNLSALVARSYPIDIVDGAICVPDSQATEDNVGVLMLLPGEAGKPLDGSEYFGDLPGGQSPETPDFYMSTISKSFAERGRRIRAAESAAVHYSTTQKNIMVPGSGRLRSRSLVVMSQETTELPDQIEGSVLGHEMDHAAFMRITSQVNPELYEGGNAMQKATWSERSAHLLSYSLLKHSGEFDGLPTPEEYIESGRKAELFKTDVADEPAIGYANKELTVKVIDLILGSPRGLPSAREMWAYKNFQLLHTDDRTA